MGSYEDSYAAYYDFRATGLPGDVDFYVQEAQRSGSPVLELGCGTGRTLIPIAQTGIDTVGMDISGAMLDVARLKVTQLPVEVQAHIKLVQGDMRDFSLGQRFKLITIPYRAFLHLMTPDDQRAALLCIREHLEEDGRLALNIFDPRLETIVAHSMPLGSALKSVSEFMLPDSGNRVIVWDTRQYDLEQQIISQYFVLEELDHSGRVVAKTYLPLQMRYVFRAEMQYLLELCGFTIEVLYGDFQHGPFRYGGEQIWIAQKR